MDTVFFRALLDYVQRQLFFRIVFYGASTTSQEFVFPNYGEIIRYVLKEEAIKVSGDWKYSYWSLQTSNRGLNGASSYDLKRYCSELVLAEKPHLVFLSMGKNDADLGIGIHETEENTRFVMQRILESGAHLVFATTVPSNNEKRNQKISSFIDLDRTVSSEFARNEKFLFIDFYSLIPREELDFFYTLIGEKNEVAQMKEGEIDFVHYSQYGNAYVAGVYLREVFGIRFDHKKFLQGLMDKSKKYMDY